MNKFYGICVVAGLIVGMMLKPAGPPTDPLEQLRIAEVQYREAHRRAVQSVACAWAVNGHCDQCHMEAMHDAKKR